jgi:hypothetical protein
VVPIDPRRIAPDLDDAALTRVIESGQVVDEIVATGEYQVAAINVCGDWAGVFRFSLSPDGDVDTETDVARRQPDRTWTSEAGGGVMTRGDVPWIRPDHGWGRYQFITFGLCGKDVEVDGEDLELVAVPGFASGEIDGMRVTTAYAEHVVVPATTGAFVAVGYGRGFEFMTLTPMRDGTPLEETFSCPRPH